MNIYESSGVIRFMNYAQMQHMLDPGNYSLGEDKLGFFLSRVPNFHIPKKIYGDVEKDADFYVDAFNRGDKNLGVIFNGEKGSGKTLLSSLIAIKLNLPVINIGAAFQGQEFVDFINEIQQPAVVLIDEYDKLYKEVKKYDLDGISETEQVDQTALLKMMDAANSSKKFFILTSNKQTISEYMINRPSRIRYKQSFGRLTDHEVKEIVSDKLLKKYSSFAQEFSDLATMFFGFNLDTLMTVIDETNRYGISPKVLIKRMNIVPESTSFDVSYIDKNSNLYEATSVEFDPVNDRYLPSISLTAAIEKQRSNKEIDQLLKQGYNEEFCTKKYKDSKGIPDRCIINYDISHDVQGITYTHQKDGYSVTFKKARYPSYAF